MRTAASVARSVVAEEAEALLRLAETIEPSMERCLRLVQACPRVIVSGLGKSGSIAAKLAGTLTSTGTRAVFMHPVEALHGDLGLVTEEDCLIAFSRSGNTDEIVRFVTHFRRLGGPVIGITMGRESRLAELSTERLLLPDLPEAGPLRLAPTTSCVLMLAAGDALAMGLLHARGFRESDFAQYHPDGTLGRRLLLRAADLMHGGEALPIVAHSAKFAELVHTISRGQLGVALVLQSDGRLLGTFTDGDLRRVFERESAPHSLDAAGAHRLSRREAKAPAVPISTVRPDVPGVECLRIMREAQITSLVVVDDQQRPVGILRLLDLVRAGLG